MSDYCSECGKPAYEVEFGVFATLCSVSGDGDNYEITASDFSDWYCFDCFPPDQ